MRFGSVCSGIEAASVAWNGLGWEAAWLAEIEPFPSAVLKYHYPTVPNLGDMTTLPERIAKGEVEAPDLFCGGTPCQAFSVAGLRKSLDDSRGNLSLTFCEIANAIDQRRIHSGLVPGIVFWENVPGVLNTKDNAFGCFLAGLAGEAEPLVAPGGRWTDAGCVFGPQRAVAWRVLDAQYFGVAQRRKRVFVVASAREGFDPTAILFESNGLRRDTAPSRKAGENAAPTIAGCSNGGGANGPGRDVDSVESLQVVPSWWDGGQVAATMTTRSADQDMPDKANFQAVLQPTGVTIHGTDPTVQKVASYDEVAQCLRARTPGNIDNSSTTVVQQPIPLDLRNAGRDPEKHDEMNRQGVGVGDPGDPAHTVTSAFVHGVAVGTDCYNGAITGDVAATMGTPGSSINASGPTVMVGAFKPGQSAAARSVGYEAEMAPSLEAGGGGNNKPAIHVGMQVRRLTPVECERLQGFPDGYTNIPWRGKPESPDGPRYKALGNSWAVPVVRWIGGRIADAVSI